MALLSNTGASLSTIAGTLAFGLIAQELRLMLLAFAGVDRNRFVWQAGLFEEESDLDRIGGAAVIEFEHRLSLFC